MKTRYKLPRKTECDRSIQKISDYLRDKGVDMPGRGLARWVLLAVAGTAFIGCKELPTRFVPVLSPQDRALAAQIPVHPEPLPRGTYLIVGRVEGLSCQITHDDPYRVSEDNAIEELQRATFRTGGDAVMEVNCEHFGRHQDPRRCIRSVVCRGIAVQMKPATEN